MFAAGLTEALFGFQLTWLHIHVAFGALCLIVIVHKLTLLTATRKSLLRDVEAFPGPPGNWLFGHVLQPTQDTTNLERGLKWGEQYPYAFPMWFGPSVCFLNIHHPDYAKTILTTTEPKDDFGYMFIESWIGNGLLVSKGQKWFRHRRLLTPGFHYDVLKHYVNLMSESAQVMLVLKFEQVFLEFTEMPRSGKTLKFLTRSVFSLKMFPRDHLMLLCLSLLGRETALVRILL
ncbi:cytochrome P450 4B1-like [Oryzias latipes]|uniref:cytochrome P450 4B1-like n=1 Tax=Oryzias latipes TaxID=8090 RepID=UPI0005CC88CA|nr:cytochrome P450 4B1-like [Oryzias latipes]